MFLKRNNHPSKSVKNQNRQLYGLVIISGLLSLVGCAPSHMLVRPAASAPPPPSTAVYFYPRRAQSAEQQDRDRYDCYLWAIKQTGLDPSAPNLAPEGRVTVEPEAAPGSDTAAGLVAGAIIGATLSPHRKSAEGAVVGAVMGAIMGASSDKQREQQAERLQAHLDQRTSNTEAQILHYRRAMSACLDGRGYTVK